MFLGIIFGILSTFLLSAGTIFRKKSMNIPTGISNYGFQFLGWSSGLLVVFYFIFSGKTNATSIPLIFPTLIFFISLNWVITSIIGQYVYRKEKLSTVAPYENLNKILSIIISFFIFGNVSIFSLGISILVIMLILGVTIDFKNISFPRNIKIFSFNQILISFNVILIGYLLTKISSYNYFFYESIIGLILLFIIMLKKKDIIQMLHTPKAFYKVRLSASILGTLSYVISLYIISSYGVVINILLSFLYLFFILIFSYLFLGDKPEKKNIYLSIIVSILVGLGFYFK